MKRILTALFASAALTATSLPAGAEDYIQPYQSESRGFSVGPGEVLAGLVALGIIAAVLDDDDDPAPAPAPAPVQPAPPVNIYTVTPAKPVKPVKPHHRRHVHILPAHCLRDVKGYGPHFRLYGRHCLSEANVDVSRLPKHCRDTIQVKSGRFVGYRESCLHALGYRTAHR